MSLYDWWAPTYDALRTPFAWLTPRVHLTLDKALRSAADRRVLDLGSGTGFLFRRCLENQAVPSTYLGIDASAGMRRRATRSAVAAKSRCAVAFERCDVVEAVDRFDRQGDRFEMVISSLLLAHLDDPQELVRRSVDLLEPGGEALFLFFAEDGHGLLRPIVRCFLWLLGARPVDVAATVDALTVGAARRSSGQFEVHETRSLLDTLVLLRLQLQR